MPTFELDANGKRFQIDAPDQATAINAAQGFLSMQPQAQAAPAPETGVGSDLAKSAGIGVAKGLIGLAGLPGDLTELGAQGLDYATTAVGRMIGQDLSRKTAMPNAPPLGVSPFGSAAIQRAIENNITGPFYTPKTTAGQYAQTVGEFLPAAAAGPGGLARRVITQAVVPGVASEVAGQTTKGTPLEPYARAAAGLAGGVGAARLGAIGDEVRATKAVTAAAPSLAETQAAGTQGFKTIEGMNVQLAPKSVADLRANIASNLDKSGTMDVVAPTTTKLLSRLEGDTGTSLERVQAIRSELSGLRSLPGPEAKKAGDAVRMIDDYVKNLTPADVIAGDITEAHKVLAQARGDWAAFKKSQLLEDARRNAELAAASSGAGTNIDNAIRQQLKAILKSPEKRAGYTADELASMRDIVTGGNIRRGLGKLAPTGILSGGLSAGAGLLLGGPIGAVALPLAGQAAKLAADARTLRKLDVLSANVRSRSPLAQSRGITPQFGAAIPSGAANPQIARAALLAAAMQHARRYPQ